MSPFWCYQLTNYINYEIIPEMKKRYYTGVGSRDTPLEILELMQDIASCMADKGMILRSGGADGADTAFETGCDQAKGKKEIYLPWKGFNDNKSKLYATSPDAYEVAEEVYGTRWVELKSPVKKLMARNMPQVMGKNLDTPSDFVVCWTPDGCTTRKTRRKQTGGTGQAIAYGDIMSVPVFNLKNKQDFEKLKKHIELTGVMEW